jgi:ABC-type transport system involved in multi-copper enzyme maturation permease subunit
MIWLTWRQLRIQAAAVYALVAAAALTLAITGPRLVRLAGKDGQIFDRLTQGDRNLFFTGIIVMAVAPAVIGVFWGAPMVARELEAGTHRLIWNQSVTRSRWLATKLGITALASALAVGALSLAVTWWSKPVDGAMSQTHGSLPSRLTPVTFAMRGIVPIGYAVFALVLGVAIGLVVRRPVPAMAITLVLYIFVQIAVPLWVRPHLATPIRENVSFSRQRMDGIMADASGKAMRITLNTGSQGNWVLTNETINAAGQATALPSWMNQCLPGPPAPGPDRSVVVEAPPIEGCLTRLNAEGYRQHIVYQPANRFWRLQWTETAMFLAFSGVLTWFSFWWIRRRVS